MFEKTCRCGKTKANFKIDIGPFFINDCCTEAGYDALGQLPQKELTDEEKALAEAAANSPEASNLQINDNKALDTDEPSTDTIVNPLIEEKDSDSAPPIEPTQSPAPEEKPSKKNQNKKNS